MVPALGRCPDNEDGPPLTGRPGALIGARSSTASMPKPSCKPAVALYCAAMPTATVPARRTPTSRTGRVQRREGWAAFHDAEQAVSDARAAFAGGDMWARGRLHRALAELATACEGLASRMDAP